MCNMVSLELLQVLCTAQPKTKDGCVMSISCSTVQDSQRSRQRKGTDSVMLLKEAQCTAPQVGCAQERLRIEDDVTAQLVELEARLECQQRKWHDRCDG